MKILIAGTYTESLLNFRGDLIRSLSNIGHSVKVLVTDLNSENKDLIQNQLPVDIGNYSINPNGLNIFSDLIGFWALLRLLQKEKPDAVLFYFAKPVIWGGLASKMAGIKHRYGMLEGLGFLFSYVSRREGMLVKLARWGQLLLFRISLRHLTALVVLNDDDRHDLLNTYKLNVKKVHVLGGIGVNLSTFSEKPPTLNPVSFIFVGRLIYLKGIREFLHAAKIVKARDPDVRFIVLGDLDKNSRRSLGKEELSMAHNQGVIEYKGQVDDVREWLEPASVFVLPSYYREGVPRSSQEAAAIGRPIITTNEPGCRETIIDGLTGYFVPPRDPVALAEAMIKFVDNPEKIVWMGKNARKFAEENFDVEKVNKALIRYLDFDLV